MCRFFSLISDGAGKVRYFDAGLRDKILKRGLKDKAGRVIESADSHSSIAAYYRLDEDQHNKWEYNPLTREFTRDQINTVDDSEAVERFCNDLDFKTIIPCLIVHPIVHPLKIKRYKVTRVDIENLKKWDSVGDSVRASVWASVGASVRDSVWASVGASVWASVGDSVWASVGASVWGYISSFFALEKWRHIDHEPGKNPYQPLIDLWNRGFVPSFDGKTWRLHQGECAKIVYEWVK